jgi:hypothetical protein
MYIACWSVVALHNHLDALRNFYLHAMNCEPHLVPIQIPLYLPVRDPGRILLAHCIEITKGCISGLFSTLWRSSHHIDVGRLIVIRASIRKTARRHNCLTIQIQLSMTATITMRVIVILELEGSTLSLLHPLVILCVGHLSRKLFRAIIWCVEISDAIDLSETSTKSYCAAMLTCLRMMSIRITQISLVDEVVSHLEGESRRTGSLSLRFVLALRWEVGEVPIGRGSAWDRLCVNFLMLHLLCLRTLRTEI